MIEPKSIFGEEREFRVFLNKSFDDALSIDSGCVAGTFPAVDQLQAMKELFKYLQKSWLW